MRFEAQNFSSPSALDVSSLLSRNIPKMPKYDSTRMTNDSKLQLTFFTGFASAVSETFRERILASQFEVSWQVMVFA